MLQYIYFLIILLIIALIYLHIKRQFYIHDNIEEIDYINYELTKTQYQELCYHKIPFVYAYNISEDEKMYERDTLVNKYSNYDVCVNNEKIELQKYFADTSSNNISLSFDNQSFLKESGLYEKIYSKDSFLRPQFTCFYDYDILLSNNSNSISKEGEQHIFQNKFYGHFIHCIDKPLTIKMVSPKFHTYFEENTIVDTKSNIFSNKKQKHIPIFNDEIMKSHKNYCKISIQNVVLQPGDLLYIPSSWYYAYKPEDHYNISIAYNYMTYMNYVLFLGEIYNNVSRILQNHVEKILK